MKNIFHFILITILFLLLSNQVHATPCPSVVYVTSMVPIHNYVNVPLDTRVVVEIYVPNPCQDPSSLPAKLYDGNGNLIEGKVVRRFVASLGYYYIAFYPTTPLKPMTTYLFEIGNESKRYFYSEFTTGETKSQTFQETTTLEITSAKISANTPPTCTVEYRLRGKAASAFTFMYIVPSPIRDKENFFPQVIRGVHPAKTKRASVSFTDSLQGVGCNRAKVCLNLFTEVSTDKPFLGESSCVTPTTLSPSSPHLCGCQSHPSTHLWNLFLLLFALSPWLARQFRSRYKT